MRRILLAVVLVAMSPAMLTLGSASADDLSGRADRDQPEEITVGPCSCTHLVYFVPSDRPDAKLDTNGAIAAAMRSQRAWFRGQMSRRPRIDLVAGAGGYDITFVRGRQPASWYSTHGRLIDELIARGFDDPGKRYLTYAAIDRGTVCGEASYPYGDPIGSEGGHATVYLDSSGCAGHDLGDGTAAGSGRADTVAVHEWLHREGAVAATAPHHCATSANHVCTGASWMLGDIGSMMSDPERADVMYPLVNDPLRTRSLDLGRDDYLDHGLPTHPDLRDSAFLED